MKYLVLIIVFFLDKKKEVLEIGKIEGLWFF